MLDATQKAKIVFYLGYSILEDSGPVVRQLNALDTRPEADAPILAELQTCEAIDRTLREKLLAIALAIQDGAIQLRGAYSLATLQAFGRQSVGRLSSFTLIPVAHDVFASAAPLGTPDGNAGVPDSAPYASGGCLPGC
jgi:hypothetical protein